MKTYYRYQVLLGIFASIFVLSACRLFTPVDPTALPPEPTRLGSSATPPPASATHTPLAATTTTTATPSSEPLLCEFDPAIGSLLDQTTAETWLDWIEKLSGAEPMTINGEETRIETRYSISMFDGSPNARAFEFVHEQVLAWYPEEQVRAMDFEVTRASDNQKFHWKNLIITIPGKTTPEEVVILSAHLDSTSELPEERAPGAADNGSGAAALLEAARLLQDMQFERTVQIIWFTGEEMGLFGSRAFVEEIDNPNSVVGVVNLDMFGYDSDNDRCFEMHVGTKPESDRVGRCFTAAIDTYNLDLPNYDYLESQATDRSDHGSFWQRDIGAIEILENMFDHDLADAGQPQACSNGDMNPNYHTSRDTVDALNGETGVEIVRAAIATIVGMAKPLEVP